MKSLVTAQKECTVHYGTVITAVNISTVKEAMVRDKSNRLKEEVGKAVGQMDPSKPACHEEASHSFQLCMFDMLLKHGTQTKHTHSHTRKRLFYPEF